jgi:hypothetical protein
MPFGVPVLTSPFPWVFIGSLFVGWAVSRATLRTAHRRDPERARHRKWVGVCVLLSLAVIFGLVALFLPGPEKIANPALLFLAVATAAVSLAAFRFKKALGLPVLVLALLLVAAVGLLLQSLHAFTGETEIARVRVISASGREMKVELLPQGGETQEFTLKGDYFAPVVKVVIFSDLYVFLGAKSWYRLEGLISNRSQVADLARPEAEYRVSHPSGISESLFAFLESADNRIPGIKSVQTEITLKKARELGAYSIRVQNDGGVEVVSIGG